MLIVPGKKIIASVLDIPSVKKFRRSIILIDIENSLRYNQEVFLINESEEVGGEPTSLFVGRSSDMRTRIQYFYRGRFVDPIIYTDAEKKTIRPEAMILMDAVSYSYIMNGCSYFNTIDEIASTAFFSEMTSDIPLYPSREVFHVPSPKYYTESHQHFAGEERQDFIEKIMGSYQKHDYFMNFRELIDENTTIFRCSIDASAWADAGGLPMGGLGDLDLEYGMGSTSFIMNFLSYMQHCVMMNLLDEVDIIMDSEEGYNIKKYVSYLNPYKKGMALKNDAMVNFLETLESEYQKFIEQFVKPIRIFLHIEKGAVKVRFLSKGKEPISVQKPKLETRTRSQSDIIFYDFDTFLK